MGWSEYMRINNLVKTIPFLSTLLLILFLGISNKKEYTKIRILIWNTPSLSLGTYLAISSGSGFILSYIATTYLSKIIQSKPKISLNFKEDIKNENNKTNTKSSYDNTLIEREIKDPSPTINASFRVIGKIERTNDNFLNRHNSNNYKNSNELEKEYYEQYETDKNIYKENTNSTDWNDDTFRNW